MLNSPHQTPPPMYAHDNAWTDEVPKQVRIAHYVYDIELMDGQWMKDSQRFGAHDGTDQVIRISSHQKRQSARDTLLHEIMHAAIWIYHLDPDNEGIKEEALCHLIAPILYDLQAKNPDLWRFLFDSRVDLGLQAVANNVPGLVEALRARTHP